MTMSSKHIEGNFKRFPSFAITQILSITLFQIAKEVIAFEVEEQAILLQYINTHTIIIDTKSTYDDTPVKDLIRTLLLIGAKCGKFDLLDYTKHIY